MLTRPISFALFLIIFTGLASIASAQMQFVEPGDARPRVVRYSCCDAVDIRDAPAQNAAVLGQLDRQEQVYVFNLFGAGLPSGLTGCLGTSAPCGTLWAEIYAVDQRLSGFVPLNALFVRKLVPRRDRLQYEIGFQLLHNRISAAFENAVIAPPGCSDPTNTALYRGSDLPGDWVLSPERLSRRSCSAVLDAPPPMALVSCEDVATNAPQFSKCRYKTVAECRAETPPNRDPSQDLSLCIDVVDPGRASCAECRDWYELTGQNATGWQTVGTLVDACLARIPQTGGPGICLPPQGGGGGGWGGDTPAAGNGFAPDGIDPGDWDPLDVPGAPEPLVSEPTNPDAFASDTTPMEAQSPCVGYCMEQVQFWNSRLCRNYIGSNDRKILADHNDFECGEIPIGRTHPNYFLNLDTGEMSGSPDPNWKWLYSIALEGSNAEQSEALGINDRYLILKMGRVGKQTSYLTQVNDLSQRERGRHINMPSRLSQDNFWLRVQPISSNKLEVEACIFLPGISIDSVPIRLDTTSNLGLFVEEIDLGGVDIDRLELCQPYRLSINNNYRFKLDPRRVGNIRIEIEPGTLQGVDITYTALTNGATVIAPVLQLLLTAVQVSTVFAEEWSASDNAELLAHFALYIYKEKIRENIVETLQSTIDTGLEQLSDTLDIPDMLDRVCTTLAPTVAQSNPTYWFNQFLLWQCNGFADDPNLRAFINHEESAAQGCYDQDWYINPQDAQSPQWWTPYSGQSWAFNLVPGSDRGCRVVGDISTNLDRDTWPTLICAMTMQNIWLNGPNFPRTQALTAAIQNNCGGFVNQALRAYYGNMRDLRQLYIDANRPTNPGGGIGGRILRRE